MIQIITTTDLLKAKPITEQLLTFGRNEVNMEIAKAVNKCIRGLNIEMDNTSIQILIEDIVDVYKWDSIEDIQVCLKNGRQGKYGKNYNKLNMIVFSEWMSKHLEQKAIERESQYSKNKHDWDSREDYLESVKLGLDQQKESSDEREYQKNKLMDYNNFKMKYEAEKGKESIEGTIKPEK